VLTDKGLIAWTRVLAELTPTPATTPPPTPVIAPAGAPEPALPAGLTHELVNILAALALVPT
jgi:hypothetical protein